MYFHAALTKTFRACVFPVLVIEPVRMVFPEECWDGTNPRYAISAVGLSNRRKSPISQTNCMAEISPMPRKPCRI